MKTAKLLFYLLVMCLGGFLAWYGYQEGGGQTMSSVLFFGGLVLALAGAIGMLISASRNR